jgi:hypothetical protein
MAWVLRVVNHDQGDALRVGIDTAGAEIQGDHLAEGPQAWRHA